MDEIRDSFLMYRSWYELVLKYFSDDTVKQNAILRAIIDYGYTNKKSYPSEPMFLDQVYCQIDSATHKHDIRVEAGRRGGQAGTGEAKKRYRNKNASKTQANASKTQANDNVNVNLNENDNDNNIIRNINISNNDQLFSLSSYEEAQKQRDKNETGYESGLLNDGKDANGYMDPAELLRRYKEGTLDYE